MLSLVSCGDSKELEAEFEADRVTADDWRNAIILRSRNPRNPWAIKHYSELRSYTSYGLIHAAALLRHVEERGLVECGN